MNSKNRSPIDVGIQWLFKYTYTVNTMEVTLTELDVPVHTKARNRMDVYTEYCLCQI